MINDATRKYVRAKEAYESARKEVVEAVVAALVAGERPTDVAAASPFTPAYVRRLAKERGVEGAPPGPKPRRGDK